MVDTGFAPEVGRRRGREVLADPVEVLADIGVHAAEVETIVVTHAHYDRIGNLARFPQAVVVMGRREFDFWQGAMARRAHFAQPTEPAELEHLAQVSREGRMRFVDGRHALRPGAEVIEVGGHTPSQLVVTVGGRGPGLRRRALL